MLPGNIGTGIKKDATAKRAKNTNKMGFPFTTHTSLDLTSRTL